MLSPQFLLPIHGELAVDLFAGGGGDHDHHASDCRARE